MITLFYRRLRRILLVCTLLICADINLYSQAVNQRYQAYIEQYRDIAIEQMLRWHIPASITLAQGLLESAAGQSTLATIGNNHFGIKCHGWQGRTIHRDDDAPNECFRAYDTAYESFEDHSRFLAPGQRYRSLFQLRITDYEGWARGLKAAGYATSPSYAQSLIDIIRRYDLSQYDRARSYDHFVVDHARDANADGQPQHAIFKYNKNYYLYARRGDTFRTLAREVGVSYRRLARYNERNKNDQLEEGEVIWLEKKRTKAPKEFKNHPHRVQAGESMYTIAQKYGIRLKSLYKLNGLSPDYRIQVGDLLRVR
ncbi:MAG: glucosaminidase domain-containing protein [Prevotella sp.]|nr:glucosaminidase domain-containing protein [Prevotella sp.]